MSTKEDEDFREEIESEAGETPPKDAAQLEVEAKARRMGWRPKDEYSGPIHKWVEASIFVERGETELPILRERMRKLDDRLASTERELTGARTEIKDARVKITEQSEVLTELRDLSLTAAQRGYQRAQAELSERQRKAVSEADTITFDRLEREKQQLEATRPVAATRPKVEAPVEPVRTSGPPPLSSDETAIVSGWISDNPWYNSDAEMNAVATSLHGLIRQQNPNMSLDDNLAEVKSRIVSRYPEKFGEARRRAPAAVSASSAPPPRSTKKTVADLPAEAKDALTRFKKQIVGYTDAEYLKSYFGSEEV